MYVKCNKCGAHRIGHHVTRFSIFIPLRVGNIARKIQVFSKSSKKTLLDYSPTV